MKTAVLCAALVAVLVFATAAGTFSADRSVERFSYDEVRASDTGRTIASVLGRELTGGEAQILSAHLATDPSNGRKIGVPVGSTFQPVHPKILTPAEMRAMVSGLGRMPTAAELHRHGVRLAMDRGYGMRANLRLPTGVEREIESAIMQTFKAVMNRGPTPAELHLNRERIVHDPEFDLPALELALRLSPEFRRHQSLRKTLIVSEMDPVITEDQLLDQLQGRSEPILPVRRRAW